MKYLMPLLGLLFWCQLAQSQQSVLKGKISLSNGAAAAQATVHIQGSVIRTIADEHGNYRLVNVPKGRQTLIVTSLEAKTGRFRVTITGQSQEMNLMVEVQDQHTLGEVEVIQKSVKNEIENSGFAANVIETKAAAYRNVQVNELLDRSIGVRVRQSGGLGSQTVYNLNGMSGRSIGVFIDGIDLSTYGSSFNLNSIPPAMIERIEVYKGVLPGHLSGDFLGGAINIILKKGGLKNSASASVSYGSFNTQQADVQASYRDQKSGFFLKTSGFYSYSDNDYEVWGKFVRNEMPDGRMVHVRAKRFNDAFKSYGGRFETGFSQVSWADQLVFSYNGSDSENEIQHGQYMSKPYMGRKTHSNAHVLGLNYSKRNIGIDGLDVHVHSVWSRREQNILDTVPWAYNWYGEKVLSIKGEPVQTRGGAQQSSPTIHKISRDVLSARGGVTYRLFPGHSIILDHSFYTVDRADRDAIKTVLEQKFQASSTLQKQVTSLSYQMKFFDQKFQSQVFAKNYLQNIDRVEPGIEAQNGVNTYVEKRFKDQRSALGYGLAMSYQLMRGLSLLTSGEKAVRMPSEGEIFGEQADNLVSNLQIRPEISHNYNLGFRWQVIENKSHQLTWMTSGFVRDTKDKIAILSNDRSVSNVETLSQINLDRTQAIGFESELMYGCRDLQVTASISRFNSIFINPEITQRHRVQLPNEPYFMANGGLQYQFKKLFKTNSALDIYYQWSYVDPFNTIWDRTPDRSTMTPVQFIQDAGMTYHFANPAIRISFDVKNMFNREAYDNFAAQKPGRAMYVKLSYTLN